MEMDCRTCRINAGENPGPGGPIFADERWVLEHALEPFPMVGWLVLKPVRHVEAFADLTEEEAAEAGSLIRRITMAMTQELRPARIYLSMFMEAEGFAHLHIHLIPRFADTPVDRRGPRVFDYMGEAQRTGQNGGDVREAERVAAAIGARLRSE